jgi:hypothetical protein
MRIRQAHNLPRVTRIGENFLITGEAGIENDFAAPARDSAGSAAVKDAPVFERQRGGAMRNFGQFFLQKSAWDYVGKLSYHKRASALRECSARRKQRGGERQSATHGSDSRRSASSIWD